MRNTIFALLLGAATIVTAPTALQADDHRVYDRDHKDYHTWNADEDRAYRRWITDERHQKYVDYGKLKPANQRAYWQWRHDHTDRH